MSERPFGWRPLSAEYRKSLVNLGLSEEQIAQEEAANVYRPVEDAVVALRCVFALLDVVARRHGSSVVHDFRTSLQRVQEVLSASEQTEEQVEGRILGRAIAEQIDWDAIIDRASDPDHARWAKSD